VRVLLINDTLLYVGGNLRVDTGNGTSQNVAIYDTRGGYWRDYDGVQIVSSHEEEACIYDMEIKGPGLIVGGSFDSASGVIVNNIAIRETAAGDWTSIGGVTSDENKIATVYALGYDPTKDILYAGGMFSNAGSATKVENIAQFSNGDWSSLSSLISRWQGPVNTILVVSYIEEQISSSTSPNAFIGSYDLMIIVSCVGAVLIIAVVLGAFALIKIRKRRSLYIEIPQYSNSKKLSLRDLANDAAIKQIDQSEIVMGSRLALGASGEVLKGTWKGREIALKRMAFGQSQMTEKFMDDFLYEIKIMSTLDHQNVLKFLGASITANGEVFLVTEFMEHGSVKDLLANTDGKIDWKLKIRLAVDAARGMQYLHSCHPPIIHRDLKNSNLLIDKKWRCKIADFGISRIKPTNTQSMTLVGTPAYMAPEVISQNKYSEKGDVYSFGVVLCELYNGKAPYSDMNLFPQQVMYAVVQEGLRPTIDPDCPSALAVLIQDCLHADPAKRPDFKEIKLRLKRL
jgi:tRNA A-37 threonylcarbamoyl transferase component Bud32